MAVYEEGHSIVSICRSSLANQNFADYTRSTAGKLPKEPLTVLHFLHRHRKSEKDFTHRRELLFPTLIAFLIGLTTGSGRRFLRNKGPPGNYHLNCKSIG